MRKTATIMILSLLTVNLLLSCEKDVIDEFSQMESFYIESKGLNAVTIDSVNSFSGKVKGYVTTYPLAKEHEKYPLILSNIKEASFRITIVIDTAWAGHDYIRF